MSNIRNRIMAGVLCLSLIACAAYGAETANSDPLDAYNVVWGAPSKDHNGSMPIGNGDIGMNVWVERNGVLVLLISKTDAWSENHRLLKIGRVRVTLSPDPIDHYVHETAIDMLPLSPDTAAIEDLMDSILDLADAAPFSPDAAAIEDLIDSNPALAEAAPFKQTLRLRQGEILVEMRKGQEEVTLRIWIDANHPVIRIEADGKSPFDMQAKLEIWRTEQRELKGAEVIGAYGLHGSPSPVYAYPDTISSVQKNRIVWYHRNEKSIWKANLEHQAMERFIAKSTDPLLHRTFGACIEGPGLVSDNPTTLKSQTPQKSFVLSIHPLSAQTETAEAWLNKLDRTVADNGSRKLDNDRDLHRAWWDKFWNRSWIRIAGFPDAKALTRAYTLQRWISACAGRGVHPIKFNGTIFTVNGGGFDCDYRGWGGPYWWQNTRLPYWPMLASGDFDMMLPLFRMYKDMLPLAEHRTQTWFGHGGSFIGEVVYFWGMFTSANYGWKRPKNLPVGELTNPYIRREYTASPELMAMMLDYYDHTDDEKFLEDELLPICDSLLEFWDRHYKNDKDGKMRMYPAQALETLQDAENPTPDIAGLKWVLERLLAIPEKKVGAKRHKFWVRLSGKVPPLPMANENGKEYVLGAGIVHGGRGNVENPELYAVFPFRLYGVGKPDLDIGRLTFARRAVRGNNGWQQDDTQAAFLGLTKTAAGYVVGRAKNKRRGIRFPAFWGPNMNWIPDQDHGGNLTMGLQTMVIQSDDGKIRLLPAWPKNWDLDFKLHAPHRTVVEGRVKNGKLVDMRVTPESRGKDVIVLEPK